MKSNAHFIYSIQMNEYTYVQWSVKIDYQKWKWCGVIVVVLFFSSEFQSDKMNLQIKHICHWEFSRCKSVCDVSTARYLTFYFSQARVHTMKKRFCKPTFRLWHVKLNLINLSFSTLFYISRTVAHA